MLTTDPMRSLLTDPCSKLYRQLPFLFTWNQWVGPLCYVHATLENRDTILLLPYYSLARDMPWHISMTSFALCLTRDFIISISLTSQSKKRGGYPHLFSVSLTASGSCCLTEVLRRKPGSMLSFSKPPYCVFLLLFPSLADYFPSL